MATVPEFISILRKIRDVIYPEINTLHDDSLALKESIDVGKAEFDADLIQFNDDYSDFNIKKAQVDASVTSASNSALSASQSAQTATNKSNEIKEITAQSQTGAPGTLANASYNPTDGKFTFTIPQGVKGDKGESFTVNSSGTTAQRALYDAQIAGWSFLDITTSILYFKISNTSGDWSTGVPFGKGDKGDTGDTGVGIVSFTFVSTTDVSGLPAKSGATDTYRVTLTDGTTFDYQVYNGLDFNIHTYTEKTTLKNEDELGLLDSEEAFLSKKIKWSNVKKSIITGFKNKIINGNKQVNQGGLVTTDNAYNYDNHYKVGNNWFMFIKGKNIASGEHYTASWDGVATAEYYIGTAGATTINAQTFIPIANGETITPTITSSQILWIKFASDTTGSTYNNVQFELGTIPTTYEQRLYELEENLVQSCYEIGNFWVIGQAPQPNGYIGTTCNFKKNKIVSPILSYINVTENINTASLNISGTTTGIRTWVSANAANIQTVWAAQYVADARPY